MKPSPLRSYTCSDYREEMRLLALKRKLQDEELDDRRRDQIEAEIRRLEQSMKMD